MVRIDPGKFNVHFKLETLSATDDGAGGTNQGEWTCIAEFWGELIQSGRGRSDRDTQFVFAYSYQVTTYWMRELDNLTERARIVTDSGKALYIHNIENVEEKNFVCTIFCGNET